MHKLKFFVSLGVMLSTVGCDDATERYQAPASARFTPSAYQPLYQPQPYQVPSYQPASYQPPPLTSAFPPQPAPMPGAAAFPQEQVRYLPAPQPPQSLLAPQPSNAFGAPQAPQSLLGPQRAGWSQVLN